MIFGEKCAVHISDLISKIQSEYFCSGPRFATPTFCNSTGPLATKTLQLMTTALRVLTKYYSNQFTVQHKQQELSKQFSGANREDFSPHGTTKNVTSRKRRKTKCLEDLDHQHLKIGLQPLRFIRKLIITTVKSVNKKKSYTRKYKCQNSST